MKFVSMFGVFAVPGARTTQSKFYFGPSPILDASVVEKFRRTFHRAQLVIFRCMRASIFLLTCNTTYIYIHMQEIVKLNFEIIRLICIKMLLYMLALCDA